MERRGFVPGLVLIALGLVLLIAQQTDIGREGVVAAIGVAFLAAYAFTRSYGFLVPGGIMTGLGIGTIYQMRVGGGGAPVLLGLGLGFLSIYVIGSAGRRATGGRWPLIPGGVLTVLGLLTAAGQSGVLRVVGRWWPVILIVIGLYLVLRRRTHEPGGQTGTREHGNGGTR